MNNKFSELTRFLSENFIHGIFISILLIIIVKYLSKNKIKTAFSIQFIRWTIIIYSIGVIITYILQTTYSTLEELNFLKRATGPYWWSYLLMLLSNTIFPLILLNKRIGRKLSVLFILSILMNLGWLFESYILHVISIIGDYSTQNDNHYLPYRRELIILTKGFSIGLIVITIENSITTWRAINEKN